MAPGAVCGLTDEFSALDGATIVLDFQAIGDMGAIGVFVDPQGASLGVWAKPVKQKKSRR